jgi:hypothetical protein
MTECFLLSLRGGIIVGMVFRFGYFGSVRVVVPLGA